MMGIKRPSVPISAYAIHPSDQMIIRRYRSLEGKRDLSTYFQQGLFCKQLSEFNDENEGLVEDAATKSGFRSGTAAIAGYKRRRSNKNAGQANDTEYLKGLKKYHRNVREQHFVNCWRLGTDERDEIWEDYTRDPNRIQGCAVETTIGQFRRALPQAPIQKESQRSPGILFETPIWNVALRNQNCDTRVGACRYQQRDKDGVLQPGGNPAAVSFFKGAQYSIENEIRVVFNPFNQNILINIDDRGIPHAKAPSVNKIFRKLPTATKWMTNRIVMAPNSGLHERAKLERWLDEFGISIDTGLGSTLQIVESADCVKRTKTHDYLAEVGGTANFAESSNHLDDIIQEFRELRDPVDWPVLDIVLLMQQRGGSIVEGYWHRSEADAFQLSDYGHNFQHVWARRLKIDDETTDFWRNKKARAFDADRDAPALDEM